MKTVRVTMEVPEWAADKMNQMAQALTAMMCADTARQVWMGFSIIGNGPVGDLDHKTGIAATVGGMFDPAAYADENGIARKITEAVICQGTLMRVCADRCGEAISSQHPDCQAALQKVADETTAGTGLHMTVTAAGVTPDSIPTLERIFTKN